MGRRMTGACLLAGLAMALAAPAMGWAAPPADPKDFSGVWTLQNYKSSSLPTEQRIIKDIDGNPVPALPWVQKVYADRIAAEHAGHPLANNKTQCLPAGVPLMMISASYPIQILQTPGQLTMLFEEDAQNRIVYLNRGHPEDPDPSYKGDSVGHWEGDTLVIDTTAFNDKTAIDQIGMPHSAALHVVERFRRLDDKTLESVMTIEDPGAFSHPWQMRRTYGLRPANWYLHEYVCEENNRNPIVNGVQTTSLSKR